MPLSSGHSGCFNIIINFPLCENIEISYLIWKSEQHILTPKYAILRSFAPLVKYHHMSEEDDGDKPLEITCQSCKCICKIF